MSGGSSQQSYTLGNLAHVAATWTPTLSSGEREKRRKVLERTFIDNAAPNITLMRPESAAAAFSVAIQIVHSASSSTVDAASVVLRHAVLVLSSLEAGEEQSRWYDEGVVLRTTSELIARWVFYTDLVPPQDAAAVRICAIRLLSAMLSSFFASATGRRDHDGGDDHDDEGGASPILHICDENNFDTRVASDLAELAQRQRYQKRTFSQGKGSQEQAYEETAAIRIAMFELLSVMSPKRSTVANRAQSRIFDKFPMMIARDVLREPGYKARDVLVTRAALNALLSCSAAGGTDIDALSEAVSRFPKSTEEVYAILQPPTKQAMKQRWQDGQEGLLPLWDDTVAILAGSLVARFAAVVAPESSQTALIAARLAALLRHPSVRVFMAIATAVVDELSCSGSRKRDGIIPTLEFAVGQGCCCGAALIDRLASIASTSTSPAHSVLAVRTLHRMLNRALQVSTQLSSNTTTTAATTAATINNVAQWIVPIRSAVDHVISNRRSWRGSCGTPTGDAPLHIVLELWFMTIALAARAGTLTKRAAFEYFAVLGDAERIVSRLTSSDALDLLVFLATTISKERKFNVIIDVVVAPQFASWVEDHALAAIGTAERVELLATFLSDERNDVAFVLNGNERLQKLIADA